MIINEVKVVKSKDWKKSFKVNQHQERWKSGG
jgi:hypothetical protein